MELGTWSLEPGNEDDPVFYGRSRLGFEENGLQRQKMSKTAVF
jgi:hypothetical protein